MTKSDFRFALLIAALWSLAEIIGHWFSAPGDILALYYGGKLFAAGAFDLLYADPTGPFIAERAVRLGEFGAPASVDPFFYPPLWAWLLGHFASLTEPAMFSRGLYIVQIPLIPASILLVARLTATTIRPPFWMALSLLLVTLTLPGHQAIYQNQLQITLTFLVLMAFDRADARHPLVAGTALALAASIKLYPALFVLVWLFRPNLRAASAFAIAGAVLGLASIAVAGWDLHLAFLARMAQQSAIVIVDRVTWNLGALLYQLTHLDTVVVLDPEARLAKHSYTGIVAAWRPGWLSALLLAGLLAAWAAILRKARTGPEIWRSTALLPVLSASISLASPVAWAHSYLMVVLFMPALVTLWPGRTGWLFVIAITLVTSSQINLGLNVLPIPLQTGMIAGTLAMIVLTLAFAFAPASPQSRRDQSAQRIPDE